MGGVDGVYGDVVFSGHTCGAVVGRAFRRRPGRANKLLLNCVMSNV